MLKHVKTPIRVTEKTSESNTFLNGYYQAGEKVDDLENFVEEIEKVDDVEKFDNEFDLESISVSSLSNLSQLSIDWSEHDRTAQIVWTRRTDPNSDLNKAKARISARDLLDKDKIKYPGQLKDDKNKQNYPENSKNDDGINQEHYVQSKATVHKQSSSSSSNSSSSTSDETAQSKWQNGIKAKSKYAQENEKHGAVSADVGSHMEEKNNNCREQKRNTPSQRWQSTQQDRYSTLQKMNPKQPNLDDNEQNSLLPANLPHLPVQTAQDSHTGIIDNTKWWESCLDILEKKRLVLLGLLFLFILIVVLISLAVKMGEVDETVSYIQDIFIDNVTFAETFTRFDQDKMQ